MGGRHLRFGGDWARVGVEKASSQTISPILSPLGPAGAGGLWQGKVFGEWRDHWVAGDCTVRGKETALNVSGGRLLAWFDCVGIRVGFFIWAEMYGVLFFLSIMGHISVMVMMVSTLLGAGHSYLETSV